ncbi:STAS domain-containing protein [Lentzea sp. NPDC034063]|uniref:STAS domain-containing protein n=1 Tax=unclassified Lentzea TaxID=2643253 RepID=UPI003400E2A1
MVQQSGGALDVLTADPADNDGIVVVTLVGEVDMMMEGSPLAETLDIVNGGPAGLVVDLQAVTFFGSSGINMLVAVQRVARSRGVPFAIVAGHAVRRPLELTGTDVLFLLRPDLPSALAAVRALPPVVPPQSRH